MRYWRTTPWLLVLYILVSVPRAGALGTVSGQITANCPSAGSPLLGVTVDAFEVGSGDLLGSATTDGAGNYSIADLAAGSYTITLLTPLGYTVVAAEVPTSVLDGQASTVNYSLTCVPVSGSPRGSGFWKHQIGVATGGNGNAAVAPATLCDYLDAVQSHFSENALNQVDVYDVGPSSSCTAKLDGVKPLINGSPIVVTGWPIGGYPKGIAVDAVGNVYVVDETNS